MVRLEDVQVFIQAVDAGSFSEAARQLNLAPGVASAAVSRLEKSLGTRLFIRSTRTMQMSDAGERYLPHARSMLEAALNGRRALDIGQDALTGVIRLSAPSDFGRNLLLPWLDEFQERHPSISLHLRLSDRVMDIVGQPIDAAIRYGKVPDSSLVALPLTSGHRRALCAAPAYVKAHGAPENVDDLSQHNCLCYVWGGQVHDHWRFTGEDGYRVVNVTGNRVSDDADVVRRWAVAGHGLIYKSRLDLLPDIQSGRLIEVFPNEICELSTLNLLCAHRVQLTPLMSKLRHFLAERCAALLSEVPPRRR